MVAYPTSLATNNPNLTNNNNNINHHLNRVPEDAETGTSTGTGDITPSHGGLVTGYEFDIPIAQRPPAAADIPINTTQHQQQGQSQAPTPPLTPQPHSTAPTATARPTSSSSNKPRPVSMPAQAHLSLSQQQDATDSSNSNGRSSSTRQADSSSIPRSRSSNRILGDYTLSKTLGAGSMGKVKLAHHNITGEKLAIKILPRTTPSSTTKNPPTTPPATPEAIAKQASKDASKEIRTLREAALSMLLHHPYICGMREIITHQHHYYMVFEYVNGGQMLDYIISHGRLRERVARKFARQIGSALEYCHRNNVVHRDLKIENILISQTGNIKIIDFGLSNLYNPASHLSTFCGSLYFAAPELLNAKVYTGPEVDVWSFGVVLYVLVCGKVPFDDQSMPALHAKIKRGLVEYPVWLSAECKHLLSRMLVTNPAIRAPMSEVLNHSWMTRNFPSPPDPHLVHREPLRADELDKHVIKGMHGFEFGTVEEIERKLVEVLESESYARAVQWWERQRERERRNGSVATAGSGSGWVQSFSNTSLISSDSAQSGGKNGDAPSKQKSKRFSGFDFYRRKLFNQGSSPPDSPLTRSPQTSSSHLSHTSLLDGGHRDPPDPTGGFHPLVSMYYLAREKLEREKVYGPGYFASSQLSLQRPSAADESQTVPPGSTKNGSVGTSPAMQMKDAAKGVSITGKADYSMPLPRLPAPETSHFSGFSYDVAVPSPTSPVHPNIPQPRARDATDLPTIPQSPDESSNVSAAAAATGASMPRAPPASTHRRSHSLSPSQRPVLKGLSGLMSGSGSGAPNKEPPMTAGPELKSFANQLPIREERTREEGEDNYIPASETASAHVPATTMAAHATSNLVRKFGTLLGAREKDKDKSSEEGKKNKRSSMFGGLGTSPRPSHEAEDERIKEKENLPASVPEGRGGDAEKVWIERENIPPSGAEMNGAGAGAGADPEKHHTTSINPPIGSIHRRAATILDPRSRTSKHERRSSTSATHSTVPRNRRPSTSQGTSSHGHGYGAFSEMDEEGQENNGVGENGENLRRTNGVDTGMDESERDSDKEFKPVFLKGLFSVSTTTTKSPVVIKQDIRRVLDRMQVQYREIKGGFECIHMPSIDLSSVVPNEGYLVDQGHNNNQQDTNGGIRRSLNKKVSKLSFGMRRDRDNDLRHDGASHTTRKESSDNNTDITAAGSDDSSFINGSSNAHTITPHTGVVDEPNSPQTYSPPKTKTLPPIPHDFAQMPTSPLPPNTPGLGPDLDPFVRPESSNLCVRFEISIVKVPILPLYGIQFRRASGDGWQYQTLARRVLTELKL